MKVVEKLHGLPRHFEEEAKLVLFYLDRIKRIFSI